MKKPNRCFFFLAVIALLASQIGCGSLLSGRVQATPTPTKTPKMAGDAGNQPPAVSVATAAPGAISVATNPPSASRIFADFEDENSWLRTEVENGIVERSTEQVYSGNYSLRLAFSLVSGESDIVIFQRDYPLDGTPNRIEAWVYGYGAGHYLHVWYTDASGELWQASFGQVQHTGWGKMTAYLLATAVWPNVHIAGPDNGVIDYPIRFSALVADDSPDAFIGNGVFFVDDLASSFVNVPPPTPAPPTDTPVTVEGTPKPIPTDTPVPPTDVPAPPTNTPPPPPTDTPVATNTPAATNTPVPTSTPSNTGPVVSITIEPSDKASPGDEVKIKITAEDPDGIESLEWGIRDATGTVLPGSYEKDCDGKTSCKIEEEVEIPEGMKGVFEVGAVAEDNAGKETLQLKQLYVQ